jgi:DnaJ like chaperone protein
MRAIVEPSLSAPRSEFQAVVGFLAKVAIGVIGAGLAGPISLVLKNAFDGASDEVKRMLSGEETGDDSNPLLGAPSIDHLSGDDQLAFFVGAITLLAKMTAADGDSTFDEVRVFRQVFRVNSENLDDVARVFNAAKKTALDYEEVADQLVEIFGARHDVLDALMDALFSIAFADHVLTSAELEFLQDIARRFGLNKVEFDQLAAMHDAKKVRDPYMVLGVRRVQSTVEIEYEYKRQMERYSPARLAEQGLPNAFGELAALRMELLTEAMERILAERGEGMSEGETPTLYFERVFDLRPLGLDFKGIPVGQDPRFADEAEREAWRERNKKRR